MTGKHAETFANYLALARLSGISALPRTAAGSVLTDKSPAPPAVKDPQPEATRETGDWDSLTAAVKQCRQCPLSAQITNYVFGEGNPAADIMFIGEAPGEEEDRQGRPFVGRAGCLLTDIITKGMRINREDVYIANILKCRPPGNRDPQPEEITSCIGYLKNQIALVRPKVIVTLGKFAAHTLLNETTSISRLRGTFRDFEGTPLMPTFHPAYLLRNESEKVKVWADIQQVMAVAGLPLPQAKS